MNHFKKAKKIMKIDKNNKMKKLDNKIYILK